VPFESLSEAANGSDVLAIAFGPHLPRGEQRGRAFPCGFVALASIGDPRLEGVFGFEI
jgi:hypothetical protein